MRNTHCPVVTTCFRDGPDQTEFTQVCVTTARDDMTFFLPERWSKYYSPFPPGKFGISWNTCLAALPVQLRRRAKKNHWSSNCLEQISKGDYLFFLQNPILVFDILLLRVLQPCSFPCSPSLELDLFIFFRAFESLRHLLQTTSGTHHQAQEYFLGLFRIRIINNDATAETRLLRN